MILGAYDHSVEKRDVPFPKFGKGGKFTIYLCGQPHSHLGGTPTKQRKEHCDVERIGNQKTGRDKGAQ